jgi:glycosyltransferase involved in cell wall biosynthesis
LRVALYYPWVHLTSGAERVISELVRRSEHDITVFTNHFDAGSTFPELSLLPVKELDRIPVRRSIWTSGMNCIKLMRQKLPLEGFDRLVVLCEGLGDLVLWRNAEIPAVCLCLTPLRACFDPHYRSRAFAQRSPLGRAALAAGTGLFRVADKLLWRRYKKVVCISGEVRERVQRSGLAPAEKVSVAHPGVGVDGSGKTTPAERFFLVPGRIMWTKNHLLAIQSFRLMKRRHPRLARFRLVIAGMLDHKSQPYLDALRAEAAGDRAIEFHLSPSDEALAELYRRCFAVLFTPFNEDWGIVPLEAMSFSKPVVAVNRGGPRETVADGVNGLLAEPEPGDFSAKMAALALAPEWASALGQAGPDHVRRFSWGRFVSRVDEAIAEAAESEVTCRETMTSGRESAVLVNRGGRQ